MVSDCYFDLHNVVKNLIKISYMFFSRTPWNTQDICDKQSFCLPTLISVQNEGLLVFFFM